MKTGYMIDAIQKPDGIWFFRATGVNNERYVYDIEAATYSDKEQIHSDLVMWATMGPFDPKDPRSGWRQVR